jgi:hypothetical protein
MSPSPLHTLTKLCRGNKGHKAHRHGENNVWRIQDVEAVLAESREHDLPNWLYLHHLLKIVYEILTVTNQIFLIFKCYILLKRGRHPPLVPKNIQLELSVLEHLY